MDLIKEPGGPVWVAEAPNFNGAHAPLKIGIAQGAAVALGERSLHFMVGQMYGVLGPGLIMAQHVFRGLKRGMLVRNDQRADIRKFAISWTAVRDAIFVGNHADARLTYLPAPANRAFVVYVSPNEMVSEFPSIFGWAEHWAWIVADPHLPGAPIDWDTRYDAKVWSAA